MLDEIRRQLVQVQDPSEVLIWCVRLVECPGSTLEDHLLARERGQAAVAELPDDVEAQHSWGYILEQLGCAYIDLAAQVYRRAGERLGTRRLWGQYVLAQSRLLRQDQAVEVLQAEIRRRGGDRDLEAVLIEALKEAGQAADALEAVEAALLAAPQDPWLHNVHGDILARLGRQEEAEEAWRRTLVHDPSAVGARYALAFALEKRGERRLALEQWQRILAFLLEHFPDDPAQIWARENVQRLSPEG